MKLLTTPQPLSSALVRAMERGVLPSGLSSWEQREMLTRAIREAAVFSARTTNAVYLQAIKEAVERALKAGYNNDRGQLRLMLKELLQRLGYTPELGFPGDAAQDIPSAEPGSLRDLSSDKRINLILETQERLMHGAGQKERGLRRMDTFPAWELVRIFPRSVPRGQAGSGTMGWEDRFRRVGAKVVSAGGVEKLMALKTDPVWAAIGDSAKFDDALDVDHPPFAFNSGMGWREVGAEEAARYGLAAGTSNIERPTSNIELGKVIPEPQFSAGRMSPDLKAALIEKLKGVRGKIGTAEMGRIGRDVRRSLGNALLDALKEAA